jgi:hypothetical protein
MKNAACLALVGVALSGCIGDIGPGSNDLGDLPGLDGDGPGPGSTTMFACDAAAVPASLPLRRLSKVQYRNAIADLVTAALPGEGGAVIADLQPMLAEFPDDKRSGPLGDHGAYTRLDQTVHQASVDATYLVATAAGAGLTGTAERLAAAAGACATNGDGGDDDACLDAFIRRFGERVLRRAVDPDDVAFYRAVAGAPPFEPADYGDVIGMLLMAPELLYFVEHGATADAAEATAPVSAYELASRLSFHFWQSIPDEALLDAARSGALDTEEGYAAAVDRLLDDPRTRGAVATFFTEWLHREDLGELDSRLGTPVFDAFIGDYLPGPDLREHMFAELGDLGLHYALDAPASFEALFESRRSFARTEDLATLYGVAPWDGDGDPPELADEAHAGLLTRAALVATGSANTRPIMKGVFIRKALLCRDIPPPPDNAAANPPELSESATTREVVEQLTEQDGTACAGCHATLINPLGFATESFDALGRVRTSQVLYDPDSGAVVGEAPIDTTSVPQVVDGDTTPSKGAADLARLMIDSGLPQACFVRQYFRFTFGRAEDTEADGCGLAALHQRVLAGDSLKSVLREVALTDAFRTRSFD